MRAARAPRRAAHIPGASRSSTASCTCPTCASTARGPGLGASRSAAEAESGSATSTAARAAVSGNARLNGDTPETTHARPDRLRRGFLDGGGLGLERGRRGERELAVGGVDEHPIAGLELALQQLQRQLVHEPLLDHPLERARAVRRVVAEVAEQRAGIVGQLDLHTLLAHTLDQLGHLQLNDLADLVARELADLH